jgi:hypothetical protein
MIVGEVIVIVEHQKSMSSLTNGPLIIRVKMIAVKYKPRSTLRVASVFQNTQDLREISGIRMYVLNRN